MLGQSERIAGQTVVGQKAIWTGELGVRLGEGVDESVCWLVGGYVVVQTEGRELAGGGSSRGVLLPTSSVARVTSARLERILLKYGIVIREEVIFCCMII